MTAGSRRKPGMIIAALSLWAAWGCEAPHESIEAILQRQQTALRLLPLEDRRRLFPAPAEPVPVDASQRPVVPSPLVLADARHIALQANPDVHAAQARLEAAVARIGEARAAYYPTLSLVHNSTRNFYTPSSRNPQIRSLPTQLPSLFTDQQEVNLASIFNVLTGQLLTPSSSGGSSDAFSQHSSLMTMSWSLFDGFAREARLLATKHNYRAAAMAMADVKRLIVHATDTAYLQALLGREQLRIARADEAFSQEQLAHAEANQESGKATRADVLNFEVRVRAAQANVTASIGLIDTGRTLLAELMGLPAAELGEEVDLPPLVDETEEELTAQDPDAWINRAMLNRPDLAQSRHSLRAAKENVLIAKGQYSPALTVSGSYGYESQGNLGYSRSDQSAALGIELNWQLYTGGFRTSQLRRAEADRREAVANLQRRRLAVASDVRRAIVSLTDAQEQAQLQRQNLTSAKENRRIITGQYQAGKASLVRLNQAQRDLVQTEVDLAAARIRLRQAWSDLYAAAATYVDGFRPAPQSDEASESGAE